MTSQFPQLLIPKGYVSRSMLNSINVLVDSRRGYHPSLGLHSLDYLSVVLMFTPCVISRCKFMIPQFPYLAIPMRYVNCSINADPHTLYFLVYRFILARSIQVDYPRTKLLCCFKF